MTRYFCKKCQHELASTQTICPKCGSIGRDIKVELKETIPLRASMRTRQKRTGFKKFLKEILQGWFPSSDTTKHPDGVEIERIIDKENPTAPDSYKENVKDIRTGQTTRNVTEPLNEHFHKNGP